MNKIELILSDFRTKISEVVIEKKYLDLYQEYNEQFQTIFAYFHSQFNGSFEFMNHKSGVNKHYNADASRDLISLIEQFEELDRELKGTENEILFDTKYQDVVNLCKTFLVGSGGSPIPEDFKKIEIIKYDPVFSLSTSKISIKTSQQNVNLIVVGEGAFSLVKKYRDENYNKYFAIKQAKKDLSIRDLQRFKNEFEILSKLNFPYILEVYLYNDEKNSYTMEYCDYTLDNYIKLNNQKLSFKNRKKIALQFLYAINYLHKKSLLHRDISYKNVLVKSFDFSSAIIKLSDFGLVKVFSSDFTKTDTEMKGTIIDPALESFKHYGLKNEIYAIGLILQFIFTGKKSLQFEKNDLGSILNKCTSRDIASRYESVSEIIDDIDALQK